jgi:hypothetical protein
LGALEVGDVECNADEADHVVAEHVGDQLDLDKRVPPGASASGNAR